MVIHNTITPIEKIPGHIKDLGLVDIIEIIIKTSTVLSQKISSIPPKIVGPSIRANEPSKTSKKKSSSKSGKK